MKSKVYLIENKDKNETYYRNLVKIIEKINYYENLKNDEKVLLNIHPRDLDKSGYVNKMVLENIEKHNEIQVIAEESLYNHTDDKTIDKIFLENEINMEHILTDNPTTLINCCGELKAFPVLNEIINNQFMIMFTHFKGHSMIGFSGALKNLATRCTNLEGQILLHQLAKPFISKIACLSCNECVNVCPNKAITVTMLPILIKSSVLAVTYV